MCCSRSRAAQGRRSTSHRSAFGRSSPAADSRTLRTSGQRAATPYLPARGIPPKLPPTRSFVARYYRHGRPFIAGELARLVQLGDGGREAARAGCFRPRRRARLVWESCDIDLEAAAGVAAQLRTRKADRSGAVGDRLSGRTVAPVPEDPVPTADLLRLDALERDSEAFLACLALQVDADVERVDAADHDAEPVAAFDDVRVDEAAGRDARPEGQRLLVRLEPAEDRLEAADELRATAVGLPFGGARRRARQTERRRGDGQEADQNGQADETGDPHGAQSYQTTRATAPVLTNPLENLAHLDQAARDEVAAVTSRDGGFGLRLRGGALRLRLGDNEVPPSE